MASKNEIPSMNNETELERVKALAQNNYDYFKHNVARYHESKRFLFLDTVTDEDAAIMQDMGISPLEVNSLVAMYNNVLGRAADMEPSLGVKGTNSFDLDLDPSQVNSKQVAQAMQTKIIDGHLQRRLIEEDYKSIPLETLEDSLAGGYSCWKIYTDYKNETTFEQDIFLEKCDDPTTIFFSPNARERTKCDADNVVKLVPKTIHDMKEEYGIDLEGKDYEKPIATDDGFNWFYEGENRDHKIVVVADFYEKKKKRVKVLKVKDPTNPDPNAFLAMTQKEYDDAKIKWEDSGTVGVFPVAVDSAMRERVTIYHSQFIGDRFLSNPVKTDKYYLPYIYVDGNSKFINGKQYTFSFVEYAKDAQRAKNFVFSDLINQAEGSNRIKMVMPERSIPGNDNYRKILEDPAKNWGTAFYRDIDPDNPQSPNIPAPIVLQPTPIDASKIALSADIERNISTSMGMHTAQMGMNNRDASGRAIAVSEKASTQTDKPQWNGLIAALQQAGRVWLSLMPTVYTELRTIPTKDENGNYQMIKINQSLPDGSPDPHSAMDFDHRELEVVVDASLNLESEKRESFAMVMELIGRVPSAQQFFGSNLDVLLDSTSIRGADTLKLQFSQYKKQQQEAAKNQPPPPDMVLAQAEMARAQNEAKSAENKNQTENRNLDIKERDAQLRFMELSNKIAVAAQEAQTKEEKDKFYMILDAAEADRKAFETENKTK